MHLGDALASDQKPARPDPVPIIGDFSGLNKNAFVRLFVDRARCKASSNDFFSDHIDDEEPASYQRPENILQYCQVFLNVSKIAKRSEQINNEIKFARANEAAHIVLYPFVVKFSQFPPGPTLLPQDRAPAA